MSSEEQAKDVLPAKTDKPVEDDQPEDKQATEAESDLKEGEIKEDGEVPNDPAKAIVYYWCKCSCDPAQYNGYSSYYMNMQTQESRWLEPDEPYWVADPVTGQPDPNSLTQPKQKTAAPVEESGESKEEYQGYNPKIHGKYDPNAPYAKWHEEKREREKLEAHRAKYGDMPYYGEDYTATGSFNMRTGRFQGATETVEHHSDAQKARRQMGAFFDVDAAANSHNGQSLKAARQQQKYTKKQIQEMNAARKEKKHAKRMAFYRS